MIPRHAKSPPSGLRCGDKAPFLLFLKRKICLIPSVRRAPSLFYWMSSQRCSGKTPGSKSNTDRSKGAESERWAGAAWETAWVCKQGYSDKMQRNATTEPFHSLLLMQREGKEPPRPTASAPGPAALCKEHPSVSDQLICCLASFQKQQLTHLCITLHQFSSKTTKWFYGRKSSPDFPQISEV